MIGFGFMYVNTANWHPFIPANTTGEFGHFGWSGIVRGAAVVFFAYIGFDAVSTAAQEAKNPQTDMPIGILASLGICTVLYILMALVMTGLAHYTDAQRSAPGVRGDRGGRAGARVADVLHQHRRDPRPRLGRARDAHGPAAHLLLDEPRRPAAAGLRQGASEVPDAVRHDDRHGLVAAFVAGFFPIALLGELVSIGTLLAFVIVCVGVMVLRYARPNIPRRSARRSCRSCRSSAFSSAAT